MQPTAASRMVQFVEVQRRQHGGSWQWQLDLSAIQVHSWQPLVAHVGCHECMMHMEWHGHAWYRPAARPQARQLPELPGGV